MSISSPALRGENAPKQVSGKFKINDMNQKAYDFIKNHTNDIFTAMNDNIGISDEGSHNQKLNTKLCLVFNFVNF